MELTLEKNKKFIEKMKVFHPKKPKFVELDDLLVYYYYNLDYSSKKEEEHKLEAWGE